MLFSLNQFGFYFNNRILKSHLFYLRIKWVWTYGSTRATWYWKWFDLPWIPRTLSLFIFLTNSSADVESPPSAFPKNKLDLFLLLRSDPYYWSRPRPRGSYGRTCIESSLLLEEWHWRHWFRRLSITLSYGGESIEPIKRDSNFCSINWMFPLCNSLRVSFID